MSRPIKNIIDAAQVWFRTPAAGAATVPTAATKPTRAPQPKPAKAPRPRPVQHEASVGSVDARKLSDADYRRHLANHGLSAPDVAPTPYQPMGSNEIESQRAHDESRRAVNRAGRSIERQRDRALRDREADLAPGAIDGRSASPEAFRARVAELLGGAVSSVNLHVRDVGLPLARGNPADTGLDNASRQTKARETVAAAIDLCQRTGQRLDVRKLDPFEHAAYLAMRGYDPV